MDNQRIVILGAGPAGMGCAYELALHKKRSVLIDKNSSVGGMCQTLNRDGYLFDIGGHRFLSKNEEINQLWKDILKDDLLKVKRSSKIFFKGKYFSYPLNAMNALKGLGLIESTICFLSFLKARFGKKQTSDAVNFEDWMVKRFGLKLYQVFFKDYTEKVWGIPCTELSSDWANQRIQSLSLGKAIKDAIFPCLNGKIKTLSQEFYYPITGPGLFYDKMKVFLEAKETTFQLSQTVLQVFHKDHRISKILCLNQKGEEEVFEAEAFFSSIPLSKFIQILSPAPPDEILEAARKLRFRHFITVYLILEEANIFTDNWIYIHSPDLMVGRVQNYKNWSSAMVPNNEETSLGLEYFVNETDELWNMSDKDLILFAETELRQLKLTDAIVKKGYVVKVANAYPVYDKDYRLRVNKLKYYLQTFKNLDLLGRAGLFRYNNSDHALLTGIQGARKLMGIDCDLWEIDIDGYE